MRRFLPLLVALLWVGCDWTEMSPVDEQVVVEAYLRANQGLPHVRLTRSVSVDGTFDPAGRAITGASVVIERLADDGSVLESYPYEPQGEPSIYNPGPPAVVQPGATYRLRATLPDGSEVTSTTTVPDTLRLVSVSRDSTEYEGEQIELTLTRSVRVGANSYLVFTSEALEPSLENATDVTLELLDADDELTVEELRITSSPPISETIYLDEESDQLKIKLPWLAVRFYGRHLIRISIVDENLYDFLRSHLVQQGGSTFLPGEVPNILDHVEGGTGIFGSYADASALVYVQRETE
ncbi:MAG TPA: DUF4249 domain-containing protein [Rhodothermales bacterium]